PPSPTRRPSDLQVAITGRRGAKEPCEDSELRTKVFESAEETKNRMTMMIVNVEASRDSGSWSSRLKKAVSKLFCVASPIAAPSMSSLIADPPMTVNQMKKTALGTRRTRATISRIVRPREILARKMPTNALHDSHHAIMK